jgi:hypothetical protein
MSNSQQITLDFSRPPLLASDGKKECRISITCSEQFKEFFDLMVRTRGTTVSELGYVYLLNGMKNDLASIFLSHPHLDKSLRELMKQF